LFLIEGFSNPFNLENPPSQRDEEAGGSWEPNGFDRNTYSGRPDATAANPSVYVSREPDVVASLSPSDQEGFAKWVHMWRLILAMIDNHFGETLKDLPPPFGIMLGITERGGPTQFLKQHLWGPYDANSTAMDHSRLEDQSMTCKREVWKQRYERLRRLTKTLIDDKQDNFAAFEWGVRDMESKWNRQESISRIWMPNASVPLAPAHRLL